MGRRRTHLIGNKELPEVSEIAGVSALLAPVESGHVLGDPGVGSKPSLTDAMRHHVRQNHASPLGSTPFNAYTCGRRGSQTRL